MSNTNTYSVGDRVILIPYLHKGKVATVKYFGNISKKFGTWVGLELDEPTGDCSGEVGVEILFECKEMHGLVIRNTQVRPFEGTAPSIAKAPILPASNKDSFVGSLTIDGDLTTALEQKLSSGISGSPLITPTQSFVNSSISDSSNKLLQKVNDVLTTMGPNSSVVSGSFVQGDDKAAKGWQARLASLKQKKAEDKKAQETNAGTDLDNEAAELRASFAPTSGIKKDAQGNIQVV
jgi:hypothetical protein